MRISKLYMPAVTLAGALALAGCGGGSSTPTVTTDPSTGLRGSGPDGAFTNADCARINGTGSTANAGGTGCTGGDTQTAQGDLTPAAILIASGPDANQINAAVSTLDLLRKAKAEDLLFPVNGKPGSVNEGKKWHEALGASKISLTILGRAGENYALSVDGKDVSDLTEQTVTVQTKGGLFGTGTDVEYMGITGRLICNGDSCAVSDDDKLTGGWYFFHDNDETDWVKDGKEYVLRTTVPHADWGVWMSPDGTTKGSGREIKWVATGDAPTGATLALGHAPSGSPDSAGKATYKGAAGGVSTLYETKEGAGDEQVGTFTAQAELTATFGDIPSVTGSIKDFKGDAVNTNWELTLLATNITSAGALTAASDGETYRQTRGGRGLAAHASGWDAQFYGENGERPSGVVGNFDGRFSDGQAVGVFHAD